MTTGPNNPFLAVGATLGYLYQVRCALLWSLRHLKSDTEFLVSIEVLDDVAFEPIGDAPMELLQTKHHRTGTCPLTDACPDLWKTLRIWFEGNVTGTIPNTARLYLVTTGVAGEGSAASYLRASPRDIARAQVLLDAVATSSENQTNATAYAAYLAATRTQRTNILENIVVIDAAPSVMDIEGELRQEVYWAAGRGHHAAFLERLEGWWFQRILRQLTGAHVGGIGSVELELKMSDLREQFKQESLPIDDDLLQFTLDDATIASHNNSTFVLQLDLAKAGRRRIASAIRDYYRAFEQRSRWLRIDLVAGMDLHKYEKRLIEEWEMVFEAMRDEQGDSAVDEAKEKAARSVLAWAEMAAIPIRPNVTEPFVCRGSLHMLSNEMRIGWHPEFLERLSGALSTSFKENTA
ncbi:MAG: hypothetical protein H3C30_09275 [Candidatus Hydrogenedentes bacterium]|nr:hypothetical protein [Candidatus Hydrogenedentota bacterium]